MDEQRVAGLLVLGEEMLWDYWFWMNKGLRDKVLDEKVHRHLAAAKGGKNWSKF